MDAEQRLAREGSSEPVAQEPVEAADAERADREPLRAFRAQRSLEDGRVRARVAPVREQQEHAARAGPPQRERESERRRCVEPLNVVDREEKRPSLREQLDGAAGRGAERPWVHGLLGRALDQKCDLECPPSRRREGRQHLVQHLLEQIAEADVSEALLGLGRPRLEDAKSQRPRLLDPVEPDRGLPDSGAALEHERCGPGSVRGRGTRERTAPAPG